MMAQGTAAIALIIAFMAGIFIQDASNPALLLPFIALAAWLVGSGRLLNISLQDPVLLGLTTLWALWMLSVLHSDAFFNSRVEALIMSALPLSYMVWRTAEFSGVVKKRLLLFFAIAGPVYGIGAILEITVIPYSLWGSRASFSFLDPNMLGVYFGMSLLPFVPVLLQRDLKLPIRLALLTGLTILCAGLIATQSRSAFLGTGLGLGLIGLLTWRSFPRTRLSAGLLAAASAAAIGMVVYTGLFKRFALLFAEGGDKDFTSRFSIWHTAFEMSLNHPLLGYGFGTFNLYYPLFRTEGDTRSAGWWVHMDPLQWAVESGWPAAVCFYALVGYIAVRIWKLARQKELQPLQIGFAAALLSLLFNAHTAYPLHVVPFMIMATGMLAMILPPSLPTSSQKISYGFAVPMLATLLLLLGTAFVSGTTLAMWKEVIVARGSQNPERLNMALANCILRGDKHFPFCRLSVIETILNNPEPPPPELPKLIEEVRETNPMLAQPDFFLAAYYLKTEPDKPELQIAALRQSLKNNPLYLNSRKALSEILIQQGRYKDALDLLEAGMHYPIPKYEIPAYQSTLKNLRKSVYNIP